MKAVQRPTRHARIYENHPLLDPFLPSREPGLVRVWVEMWRGLSVEARASGAMLPMLSEEARDGALLEFEGFHQEADSYVEDVLEEVGDAGGSELHVRDRIRTTNDPDALLHLCLKAPDRRTRFEAQRKLCLTKLLVTIDHSRTVRDARLHLSFLEARLEEGILARSESQEGVELCCRFVPWEQGGGSLEFIDRDQVDARCWRFPVRRIAAPAGDTLVDLFFHRCRFKRDPLPDVHPATRATGSQKHHATSSLGRRSGSILSKMIRCGLTDPAEVQDVLGAMFIVADRRQAYALEKLLHQILGGVLWVRDRTDSLCGNNRGNRLSEHSSAGFEVLKETVDLFVQGQSGDRPYHVPVELQIYPVASYLATLHEAHDACHAAYKRRQLLEDVFPVLFPASIYGVRPT